ncbi:hypothetical protein E2C01_050183 [Portunus trituberculatus]|uniref:Uncharacterized protein n=1 Tax=Portunus trituberculatus TaxID=210409 RepID=A0A5B7GFD6_PORTR|nr:hypothetical protein [Portunus trituberculatus]
MFEFTLNRTVLRTPSVVPDDCVTDLNLWEKTHGKRIWSPQSFSDDSGSTVVFPLDKSLPAPAKLDDADDIYSPSYSLKSINTITEKLDLRSDSMEEQLQYIPQTFTTDEATNINRLFYFIPFFFFFFFFSW